MDETMSWFPWSNKKRISSLKALKEPFRSLIDEVLKDIEEQGLEFKVFETLRTKKRQAELVEKGRSHTMRSKHLEGYACDIVHLRNGRWDWSSFEDYLPLGRIVRSHPHLRWGGDWRRFRDGPHIELIT